MKTVTVIMSASRSNESSKSNSSRTQMMLSDLSKLGLLSVPCKGVFEGVSEDSFTIPTTENMIPILVDLACNDYEQDCILVIKKDLTCYLTDNSKEFTKIGKWCKVTAKEAKETDHTFYPQAGIFYVVK